MMLQDSGSGATRLVFVTWRRWPDGYRCFVYSSFRHEARDRGAHVPADRSVRGLCLEQLIEVDRGGYVIRRDVIEDGLAIRYGRSATR
jgi:hypothetical protein